VTDPFEHGGGDGTPCRRHAPAEPERFLHLATIGSRVPSFNHDIASKIQGLIMAIDEIVEFANTSDLRQAAETAHQAVTELNQLLQQNRALTKTPVASSIPIDELVDRAARRVAVTLRGGPFSGTTEVPALLVIQGLALAFDAAAGSERRRVLDLAIVEVGDSLEIRVPLATALEPDVGTMFAIASWVFRKAGGSFACQSDHLELRLPRA